MVQQKDRYKEKVGGRPAKLNEKKKNKGGIILVGIVAAVTK